MASSWAASVTAASAALSVLDADADDASAEVEDVEVVESDASAEEEEPEELTTPCDVAPALFSSVEILVSSFVCSSESLSSRSEVSSPAA